MRLRELTHSIFVGFFTALALVQNDKRDLLFVRVCHSEASPKNLTYMKYDTIRIAQPYQPCFPPRGAWGSGRSLIEGRREIDRTIGAP